MREFVRSEASTTALRDDRVDDLVLAANEIVTNSVRHGGGRCVVADVGGRGRGGMRGARSRLDPRPDVGRLAPPADAASGRGLWLANHLCDLLQIRSSPRGTVVRLVVDR